VVAEQREERVGRPDRRQQPGSAARERQHQALDELLPDDVPTPGPDGEPNRDFSPP
jgi:hypothetical protein